MINFNGTKVRIGFLGMLVGLICMYLLVHIGFAWVYKMSFIDVTRCAFKMCSIMRTQPRWQSNKTFEDRVARAIMLLVISTWNCDTREAYKHFQNRKFQLE